MAIQIIKKNGSLQDFDGDKIKKAIRKSATRVCVELTDKEENVIRLIESCPTEKKIRKKRKVYNIYFVPLGTVKNLKVGDKLNIVEK